MPYSDRFITQEFPYKGIFYKMEKDLSLPPSQQKLVRVAVLEVKCNMQEAHSSQVQGLTTASYKIYFPYEKSIPFPLRRGMFFEGDLSGMPVTGEVIGVYPSQVGKCVVYIKDLNT